MSSRLPPIDVLAPGVEELADALLAVTGLDELEGGVAEVVGLAPRQRLVLAARDLRDLVRDGALADHHHVERIPQPAQVVGKTLVDPQRHAALEQAARNQVELEDMRELVRDQPLQAVRRLVDRHHHPVSHRLGEGQRRLGYEAVGQVRLLELGVGLVQHQRDRERHFVLQLGGDLLVAALGVGGDSAQVLLELRVVVDLEVRALVDAPGESVVLDLVLAEVREVLGLGGVCPARAPGDNRGSRAASSCRVNPRAAGRGCPGFSGVR